MFVDAHQGDTLAISHPSAAFAKINSPFDPKIVTALDAHLLVGSNVCTGTTHSDGLAACKRRVDVARAEGVQLLFHDFPRSWTDPMTSTCTSRILSAGNCNWAADGPCTATPPPTPTPPPPPSPSKQVNFPLSPCMDGLQVERTIRSCNPPGDKRRHRRNADAELRHGREKGPSHLSVAAVSAAIGCVVGIVLVTTVWLSRRINVSL
eukprot:m.85252 g.85252  ORF g.85252 m.85252 type:complete len:207 (+) comp14837_c0_seq2:721-1341(+)